MESGLLLSILEPVAPEYCNQTVNLYCDGFFQEENHDNHDCETDKLQVEEGDILYVDYEGTLEVTQ